MESEILNITPDVAKAMLDLNIGNRKIRQSHVRALADAMKRGEWVLSPQGVAISSEDVILDGQHRLAAVVASGATVPMTVWRGVDPAVFPILDRGVSRTLADAIKVPPRHAGVLTFFHGAKTRMFRKPTAQEASDINDVFGDDIESLLAFAPSSCKGFTQVGVVAAAVLLSREGQRVWAFDLFRRLSLGDTDGLPPIVSTLVRQVLNGTFCRGHGGDAQVQSFSKALFAFDKKNEERKHLIYTPDLRARSIARIAEALA